MTFGTYNVSLNITAPLNSHGQNSPGVDKHASDDFVVLGSPSDGIIPAEAVLALGRARPAAVDIPFGLLLRERLVDDPAERLQRLSTPDRRALHEVARRRLSHHEGGRALDADGRAVCEASLDPCRVPA